MQPPSTPPLPSFLLSQLKVKEALNDTWQSQIIMSTSGEEPTCRWTAGCRRQSGDEAPGSSSWKPVSWTLWSRRRCKGRECCRSTPSSGDKVDKRTGARFFHFIHANSLCTSFYLAGSRSRVFTFAYLNANIVLLFFSHLNKHSEEGENRLQAEEGALGPDHSSWQDTQDNSECPEETLSDHKLPVPFWERDTHVYSLEFEGKKLYILFWDFVGCQRLNSPTVGVQTSRWIQPRWRSEGKLWVKYRLEQFWLVATSSKWNALSNTTDHCTWVWLCLWTAEMTWKQGNGVRFGSLTINTPCSLSPSFVPFYEEQLDFSQ